MRFEIFDIEGVENKETIRYINVIAYNFQNFWQKITKYFKLFFFKYLFIFTSLVED